VSAPVAQEWVRWSWVADHTDDIRAALVEHVQLTALAVAIGLLIALPLGVLASRRGRIRGPVLAVEGALYAIPSLALFVLLAPWTGFLSRTTVLIGLVTYTLLILTRNVVAGLDGVPAEVVESATAMGYSPARRFWRVELPLALPAVVAGVRIATVSTVALTTVGFIVGHGGLGELIEQGLRAYGHQTQLTVGIVLTVALALLADLLLLGLQRVLTPWARAR
jgi:osmoprotectant transport system permease protein